MTDDEIGCAIIDAIVKGGLVRVDEEVLEAYKRGDADGLLYVWKQNAHEQIGALAKDLVINGKRTS